MRLRGPSRDRGVEPQHLPVDLHPRQVAGQVGQRRPHLAQGQRRPAVQVAVGCRPVAEHEPAGQLTTGVVAGEVVGRAGRNGLVDEDVGVLGAARGPGADDRPQLGDEQQVPHLLPGCRDPRVGEDGRDLPARQADSGRRGTTRAPRAQRPSSRRRDRGRGGVPPSTARPWPPWLAASSAGPRGARGATSAGARGCAPSRRRPARRAPRHTSCPHASAWRATRPPAGRPGPARTRAAARHRHPGAAPPRRAAGSRDGGGARRAGGGTSTSSSSHPPTPTARPNGRSAGSTDPPHLTRPLGLSAPAMRPRTVTTPGADSTVHEDPPPTRRPAQPPPGGALRGRRHAGSGRAAAAHAGPPHPAAGTVPSPPRSSTRARCRGSSRTTRGYTEGPRAVRRRRPPPPALAGWHGRSDDASRARGRAPAGGPWPRVLRAGHRALVAGTRTSRRAARIPGHLRATTLADRAGNQGWTSCVVQ